MIALRRLFQFLPFRRSVQVPPPAAQVAEIAAVPDPTTAEALEPATAPAPVAPPVFSLMAHLQGRGDTKAGPDGWVGRATGALLLEGFTITCDTPGWREHVTIQARGRDQTLSDPVHGGNYCGTRGKMISIYGFIVHVPAEAGLLSGIFYQGVFQDGFRSGLLSPGSLCASPSNAALLAMRITTDPHASDAPPSAMAPAANLAPPGGRPTENEGLWEEGPVDVSLVAHLAGRGDTAAGTDGWAADPGHARRIEGFFANHIMPGWARDVTCLAVLRDGSLGPQVTGGTYCGTRGQGQPLFGFMLQTQSGRKELAGLGYEGVFEDGFTTGLLVPGTSCVSPSGAALVAMRITTSAFVGADTAEMSGAEKIRLVIWDLDEVFWGGTLTEGGIVWREETARTVRDLAGRGIISSICSKNAPEDVFRVLDEHDMRGFFVFPSISWDPKGPRLAALIAAVQLRAPNVLFIDDNPLNRAEASQFVPGLQVRDEDCVPRLLDDSLLQGKPDPSLTRLEHYRLLERLQADRVDATGDTTEFLRASNITVYIEHDIEPHIDRAVELINRTNQLNFTKSRLPEDPDDSEVARRELRALLRTYNIQAGLLHVHDKYGDYGFCGIYVIRRDMTGGGSLLQFAFSCRILGMGVEKWLYRMLKRPYLPVSSQAVSDVLDNSGPVDWIALVSSMAAEPESRPTHGVGYVLARGACDMRALSHYFTTITDTIIEEIQSARLGQATQIGHSLIAAQALRGMPGGALADFAPLGFVPQDFETALAGLLPEGPAVWLFGFHLECQTPIYRHIATGAFLPAIITGVDMSPAAMMNGTTPSDADPAIIAHMRENFVFFGQRPDLKIDDLFRESLRLIFARAPSDVRIFVLLSNTHPSSVSRAPPTYDRHNQIITEIAEDFANVELLLPEDFMTQAELAALDHVHHYNRITYYRIFSHIAKRLET